MRAMTKVQEKPIIFSGESVRALLDGRKTQTRRVLKPQPERDIRAWSSVGSWFAPSWEDEDYDPRPGWRCPYGSIGYRLWVRETFCLEGDCDGEPPPRYSKGRPIRHCEDGGWAFPYYKATDEPPELACVKPNCGHREPGEPHCHWKPAIHMPRWASRITLEITRVRVERLQDITEEDAQAEGAMFFDGRPLNHHGWRHDYADVFETARLSYRHLWDSLNAKRGYGWERNPWVWVLEFKRV